MIILICNCWRIMTFFEIGDCIGAEVGLKACYPMT